MKCLNADATYGALHSSPLSHESGQARSKLSQPEWWAAAEGQRSLAGKCGWRTRQTERWAGLWRPSLSCWPFQLIFNSGRREGRIWAGVRVSKIACRDRWSVKNTLYQKPLLLRKSTALVIFWYTSSDLFATPFSFYAFYYHSHMWAGLQCAVLIICLSF